MLQAYLAGFPAEPMGAVQIFCNRSSRPYSRDTLGDDFRDVRAKVFGDQERRQLADFRRSGATEALAGHVPEMLSSKSQYALASNRRHRTYAPVQLAAVRDADEARKAGRRKLREQNRGESSRAPAKEFPNAVLAKS